MNPMWLQLILLALQDTPAIVSLIEIGNLPDSVTLTDAQMQTLQDAMDAAMARADADVAKKFPTTTT